MQALALMSSCEHEKLSAAVLKCQQGSFDGLALLAIIRSAAIFPEQF
jgi:hypothetical protein